MTRLLVALPALVAVVALAGSIGPPPTPARAQAAQVPGDTVTVSGTGSVEAIPDQAELTFGVVTHASTASAALSANAAAMTKVIAALRAARARDLATQWVSVWPVSQDNRAPESYSASNSVSATIGVDRAGDLIDAGVEAGAVEVSGPGLTSSDASRLYRQALAAAVADARERAEVIAKAANRRLGAITTIAESSSEPVPAFGRATAEAASTPIVPGQQETTANVTVTFVLQ